MAMLVRHAMTDELQTATPDDTAQDAARMMDAADVGVIPVVEEERLIGLVTDRDLAVRLVARGDDATTSLRELATQAPVTVTPDTKLADAQRLMSEHRVRRLPVVKDDQLVGVISLGDVAVAIASKREVGETLEDISESASTQPDTISGPEVGTPQEVR
jgi:CBS domain-containing protein